MKTSKTILAAMVVVAVMTSASAGADTRKDADEAYTVGDYAKYLNIVRPLAQKGEAQAQFSLGASYEYGHGIPQNYTEAAKWYLLAAKQGHPWAETNLGQLYSDGKGVDQDYAQAAQWYLRAAARGYWVAQLNLGIMYRDGMGVPQDYIRAHMWFNLAAASRKDNLLRENREMIASKMSPSQIAEAQKLARECQRRNLRGC